MTGALEADSHLILSTGTRGGLFASHTWTWLLQTPHTPAQTCERCGMAPLSTAPLQASRTDGKTARRHRRDLNSAGWIHLHVQKLRFYHPCCSNPRGHKCWLWHSRRESSGLQTLLPHFVTFPRVSACGSAARTALALRAPTIQLLAPECSHGLHQTHPASHCIGGLLSPRDQARNGIQAGCSKEDEH